jgi:hypothetical protein
MNRFLCQRLHGLRTVVTTAGAIVALSSVAAACPYCAVSQSTETLLFITAFLVIPYVVVTAVMFWMKRVLASEHEG